MRDLLITFIVALGCFYSFKKPYIGILLWSWLSYMNPHRLAYGFAYNMPYAYITAITLLIGATFSRQTQKLPINAITLIWMFFIAYMGLTTIFAFFPDAAWEQYFRIVKIQLMVFLTMKLITDLNKLNQLLWVIAASIGYYSIKGGIFTLTSGGGHRVWGPADSFIEGNNELAVATLMIIPLLGYLYQITRNIWLKRGLLGAMPLSFVASMGTQSRGALIAFGAVVVFFWIKSKQKVGVGIALAILSIGVIAFMPESWHQRMNTIENYQEDSSAMGRINAWTYALNAANDNFLGVGLDSWSPVTFALYAPNPNDVHAAHSIYFSVLADHGWVGLILFLIIYLLTWRKLSRFIKNSHQQLELESLNLLARMVQVSLIAYLVGGAFLSLSYFDLPWHLVSIVVLIEKLSNTDSNSKRSLNRDLLDNKRLSSLLR